MVASRCRSAGRRRARWRVPLLLGAQWAPAVGTVQILALNGPRLVLGRLAATAVPGDGTPVVGLLAARRQRPALGRRLRASAPGTASTASPSASPSSASSLWPSSCVLVARALDTSTSTISAQPRRRRRRPRGAHASASSRCRAVLPPTVPDGVELVLAIGRRGAATYVAALAVARPPALVSRRSWRDLRRRARRRLPTWRRWRRDAGAVRQREPRRPRHRAPQPARGPSPSAPTSRRRSSTSPRPGSAASSSPRRCRVWPGSTSTCSRCATSWPRARWCAARLAGCAEAPTCSTCTRTTSALLSTGVLRDRPERRVARRHQRPERLPAAVPVDRPAGRRLALRAVDAARAPRVRGGHARGDPLRSGRPTSVAVLRRRPRPDPRRARSASRCPTGCRRAPDGRTPADRLRRSLPGPQGRRPAAARSTASTCSPSATSTSSPWTASRRSPGVRVINDITPRRRPAAAILGAATVFVFPSEMDLSPNAVLEAMAVGPAGGRPPRRRRRRAGRPRRHRPARRTRRRSRPRRRHRVAAARPGPGRPDGRGGTRPCLRAVRRPGHDRGSWSTSSREARDRHGRTARGDATVRRSRVGTLTGEPS